MKNWQPFWSPSWILAAIMIFRFRSKFKCSVITYNCAKLFACRIIRTLFCHNTYSIRTILCCIAQDMLVMTEWDRVSHISNEAFVFMFSRFTIGLCLVSVNQNLFSVSVGPFLTQVMVNRVHLSYEFNGICGRLTFTCTKTFLLEESNILHFQVLIYLTLLLACVLAFQEQMHSQYFAYQPNARYGRTRAMKLKRVSEEIQVLCVAHFILQPRVLRLGTVSTSMASTKTSFKL